MKIEICTSYPDDQLEGYRPKAAVIWELIISGYWSQDRYHSGHIAYYLARTGKTTWVLDSVARSAELDGVTDEDIEQGRLNDDQIQALRGTTLREAQAHVYKRITAACCDAPPDADRRLIGRALYAAVESDGGRVVDEPADDWDDLFGVRSRWER
jgi:hypothetical protein